VFDFVLKERDMSGQRGLGATQFSNGSSSNTTNNTNATNGYSHNCCSSAYPDVGRVQVTAKILFGSAAAIQTVNAEKCRKK